MPSITIYTSEDQKIEKNAFSEFSVCLKNITKKVLQAENNNIHIAYLTSDICYGKPIYFEAKLRKEVFRSEEVMKTYLHQVDLLIEEKMGVKARIRCFMYDVDYIFAKN